MRVLFLCNNKARRCRELAEQAKALLTERGVEILEPNDLGVENFADAISLHASEVQAVVVAGGDGSVNAAVSGLLNIGLPLGVIPLGTANNFARNLDIPFDIPSACDVIAKATPRRADIGFVNDSPFLNVVGLGVSTHVNQNVSHEIKKRFGTFGYFITALKFLRSFKPARIEILNVDSGERVRIRTFQLTICNGRFFGSGLSVRDSARIDDGKIDLASFEVADIWEGIKLLFRFRFRKLRFSDPLRRMRASQFVISSPKVRKVDVDGEIREKTPLRIALVPKSLLVFT